MQIRENKQLMKDIDFSIDEIKRLRLKMTGVGYSGHAQMPDRVYVDQQKNIPVKPPTRTPKTFSDDKLKRYAHMIFTLADDIEVSNHFV